jgi:hypothetical protein
VRQGTFLWLALLTLGMACAGSAIQNREHYTRVVIDNQQWEDATVRIYCGSAQAATVRVSAGATVTRHLLLLPCGGGIAATARFLGHRGHVRASPREYGLDGRSYVKVTVPNNLDIVFLAIYKERER